MGEKMINKIFLSAGIPEKDDDIDRISIRDAVLNLCDFAKKENMQIVHGGHPAITSLLSAMAQVNEDLRKNILIYQAAIFSDDWETYIKHLNMSILFGKMSREEALEEIRLSILERHKYQAGVFVCGGEGIRTEYNLFKSLHPNAVVIPLGSTGGVAKELYDNLENAWNINEEYNYLALYKELIKADKNA